MSNDLIERLWKEGREGEPPSRERLLGALTPRVERGSRLLRVSAWMYLLVQAATMVLAGTNLAGYRTNPTMIAVQLGVLLAALAFAAFGVKMHAEIRSLERLDESLAETVRHRLEFYRTRAVVWAWTAALSIVAFTFALNTWIDNVDGRYPIHHPFVFVGVHVATLFLLVLSFRMAHEPRVRELRATLEDLESQLLDRTAAVDRERGRWRAAWIALIVVLFALAALGAWVALRHAG